MEVSLLLLLGLSCQASAAFIDTSMILLFAERCMNTEGATEADVQIFIEGKLPEKRQQKCVASCIGRQFEIVSFYIHIKTFCRFDNVPS